MRERGGRTAGPGFLVRASRRADDPHAHRQGHRRSCRREPRLEPAACQLPHAAHQPSARVQHRRRVHQWRGILLLPPAPRRDSAITIISPGRISSAMPRRRPGGKTSAASATASRCMALSGWRCSSGRRSTSAVTGSDPGIVAKGTGPPHAAKRLLATRRQWPSARHDRRIQPFALHQQNRDVVGGQRIAVRLAQHILACSAELARDEVRHCLRGAYARTDGTRACSCACNFARTAR